LRYYCWLIDFGSDANCAFGGHDDLGDTVRLDDESMTGLVGQLPEDREQVCFRPIRSIIRLNSLNFWESCRQDVGNLLLPSPCIARKGITDRELSLSRRLTARSDVSHMLDGQFPSHIIQGSSEPAGEIRNDRPPGIRDGGRLTEVLPSIFIFLGDCLEDCGTLIKLGDSSLEVAEVCLRSITLKPSIIQRVGNWNHE